MHRTPGNSYGCCPRRHRLRKRSPHLFHRERQLVAWSRRASSPRQQAAERDQRRKRDKKLRRRREPQPITCPRVILPQSQRQQSRRGRKQRRLPQVIPQSGPKLYPQRAHIRPHQGYFSFFSSFRTSFSASFTSSSVSFPDSIKCAITGCVLPPNSASKSSISFRCAASRDTTGSNT